MGKKVYHIKFKIKQFKEQYTICTRVYPELHLALDCIRDLNNMFHQTLLEVKLFILEEEDLK